jgi:hypothetical protein
VTGSLDSARGAYAGQTDGADLMTDVITRRALPLLVVCIVAPAAGAQPIL